MPGYIPAQAPTNDENARPMSSATASSSRVSEGEKKLSAVAANSFYGPKKAEKIVIGEKSNKQRLEWGGSMFNPKEEGAVVMQRPTDEEAKKRSVSLRVQLFHPSRS